VRGSGSHACKCTALALRFYAAPVAGDQRDLEPAGAHTNSSSRSFCATDLPVWGSALLACQHLGDLARVLVDLGHRAQGVNVEQIVAVLSDQERLGGFHFNNRKYADHDLIVGSVNPFELSLPNSMLGRPLATDELGDLVSVCWGVFEGADEQLGEARMTPRVARLGLADERLVARATSHRSRWASCR
jgi:hypothetical protein